MRILRTILIIVTIILLTGIAGCSSQQEVAVYFAVESGTEFYLCSSMVKVEASPDIYQASLEALIAGPKSDEFIAVLPPSVEVRSVTLDNGLAIADFSKELLTDTSIPHSSTTETLAIYSIVNTLTQFDEIQKVRIMIEGRRSGTVEGINVEDFWGHIGIGSDFSRSQDIIMENEL